MKNKKVYLLSILTVFLFSLSLNWMTNEESEITEFTLANIEALAQKEDALPYESVGCRSFKCANLVLEGEILCAVYQRDCYIKDDGTYSSCYKSDCGYLVDPC